VTRRDSSTTIRVEGLSKLTADLLRLGVDVNDLKGAFADIADAAAREARRFAPRRSGALVASIRGNRAKNKATVTAGNGRVRYAAPINYGWRKRGIEASNYMQRASDAVKPRVVPMLDAALSKLIAERGLK